MTDWILDKLADQGARDAFHLPQRTWTFAEFAELVRDFRESLSAIPDQQIIELDPARPVEGLAILLAIVGSHHIAFPLSRSIPTASREEIRRTACVTLSLKPDGRRPNPELVRPAQQSEPKHALYRDIDRGGLILLSSGTTGQPKLMLHKLDALLETYRTLRSRTDRTLLFMPIDHIGGFDAAFRSIFAGSEVVIPAERSPDAVGRAIQEHRVNVLPAPPTFLNLMKMAAAFDRYDCTSIEIVAYGAESMPGNLLRQLNVALPHADFQQKFGTSETGAIRIRSEGPDSLYFKIIDPDTDWKILEDELWLRSPSRILGYLNAEETSLEADGWYRTGDLVEVTENKFIRILGRKNSLINVGGEKVTPSEVESVLLEMPEVADCLVYGEANALTGQNVAAQVVARDPAADARQLKREIKRHCRQHLSPYKVPARITLTEKPLWGERFKKSRQAPSAE